MDDFYCKEHECMASKCYDEHPLCLDSSDDPFKFGKSHRMKPLKSKEAKR